MGTRQKLQQLDPIWLHVGEAKIEPTSSVRNLGAIFDSQMTMMKHILTTCKTANYHIRNIGRIRNYLTKQATEQLVHAFISTKLDYANGLLSGVAKCHLEKLQRVQNTAARIVAKVRKQEHITPVLKRLHWLPVEKRIRFKVLLLTYKSLHGQAPEYLKDLLHPNESCVATRSSEKVLRLFEPRCNLTGYGDHSFEVAAPRLWNQLPNELKSCMTTDTFKRKLKQHMFKN